MARAKSKAKAKRGSGARRGSGTDAIALLKADHRQVEAWFSQFEKTRASQRKADLAAKICKALKVHTQIEEEIFYPAFMEATSDKDTHHEAVVEHDGAKKLIAEIESGGADDDYFDAKVSVLSEMIKHHVKEEEGPGGMFRESRRSDMDLNALGAQLKHRKSELMADGSNGRSNRGSSRAARDQAEARAANVA